MRRRAVVAEDTKRHEGERDHVGADHPFFVDFDLAFADGVVGHRGGRGPGGGEAEDSETEGPSERGGEGEVGRADYACCYAAEEDASGVAVEVHAASGEPGE